MIITNTKIDANMKFEDSPINELSHRSPFLLINTPCGIGKYRFNKVYHNEVNELIFEYELVDDDHCKDASIIKYYIGDCYYLSAVQVLYAFNYISNS